jgi:hypothetical protein
VDSGLAQRCLRRARCSPVNAFALNKPSSSSSSVLLLIGQTTLELMNLRKEGLFSQVTCFPCFACQFQSSKSHCHKHGQLHSKPLRLDDDYVC